MSYEELVKEIEELPLSYLPGIFITIVEQCSKRPVFRSPEAMELVFKKALARAVKGQ